MIETALFFVLGFLCAGFLALMVAPSIWRRAVVLTRRRIEASVPLSIDEIQADKDRQRAEFAMSTRRLERELKEYKEKAARQIVEINRNREGMKRLAEDIDERKLAIAGLETRVASLEEELRQREEQLRDTSGERDAARHQLEEQAAELDQVSNMYQEASLVSSSRQIELVARESEIDKLSDEIGKLRGERKEADKRVREITTDNKSLRDALRAEQKKVTELERKLARAVSAGSDRDERIERRERELARLKEQLAQDASARRELETVLSEERKARANVEAELADARTSAQAPLVDAGAAPEDGAVRERNRLEERLTTLVRENKKLRAEAAERGQTNAPNDEHSENAMLREKISDLAAEVVGMTALLDGPGSPIRRILSETETPGVTTNGERVMSLADRVRALQKAVDEK